MSRLTPARRLAAAALAALIVGVTFAPLDADARAGRGGGFGSRGSKTFSSPPPTATAPGAAPIQRSTTPQAVQPGQPSPGLAGAAQQRRPGFFGGGLGAGLMGGLLGAGLFGLLSGSGLFGGLGSLASIIGLLLQVALIVIVVRFALGWWRRRQQGGAAPAYQGASNGPGSATGYRYDAPPSASNGSGSGFGSGFGFGRPAAPAAVATTPLTLEKDDFDLFERMLSDVQDAWSAQDLPRLRTLATPEMVDGFAADLSEDASRGVVNRVTGAKLLQGDLSEAWREVDRDYATVAMRYEIVDVTEDRASGRVVDGDPSRPVEATELWTFVRVQNGGWLLSAIQQSA